MFSLNPATLIFDFRFDIANALIQSQTLSNSINHISESAMQAERSMTSLGVSVLAGMGAIPSGIVGAMGAAIKASESFDQTALSWSNLISANRDVLSGPIQTHDQRMKAAYGIMKDISKISREFGIPQKEMSDFSKMMNANLIRKGLQGDNFETGHTMARQLLKSAPNLGIDPGLVMGQLIRAIQGGAGMGDPLFRALSTDTQSMQKFSKPGGAELFNALSAKERVNLLNSALGDFAKDTAVNTARFHSLTNQLQVMKDVFMGFEGILKPLGDRLKGPIVEALVFFNKELDTNGRLIMENVAKMFGLVAPNAETALINLTQAQRLRGSLDIAKDATSFLAHVVLVKEGFGLLKRFFPALNVDLVGTLKALSGNVFSIVTSLASFLRPMIAWGARMAMTVLPGIAMTLVSQILIPITMLIGALTTIDRAIGIARVKDIKAMPKIAAEISQWTMELSTAFMGIMMPFTLAMDAVAEWISPLFQVTTWMEIIRGPVEFLIKALQGLSSVMLLITANTEALGQGIGAWMFNTKDKDKGFGDRVDENYLRYMTKFQELLDRGAITPKQEVNIGRVSIENKFKENMEPDRIAFTIKDQLLKLANNNTQAKSSPLFPAYGRP